MKTPLWKQFLLGKKITPETFFERRKNNPLIADSDKHISNLSDEEYCDRYGRSMDFIIGAFTWRHTPEGHGFWNNMSTSWIKFLKKQINKTPWKKHHCSKDS